MKKRSMLAIASLATGFVVAAITPSHAAHTDVVGDPKVNDTLSTVDHLVSSDSPVVNDKVLGQHG